MNFRIEKMRPLKFIGFERVFDNATAYAEIPEFWDEIMGKYADVFGGRAPENDIERAVLENGVGEYGVCIDDMGAERFRYLIAGEYVGGPVPEGMTLYEFPACCWAVFDCTGPLPDALQSVNTRVFSEWLPGNPDWELYGNATVEWYGMGPTDSPDYKSAIWVPVRRKYSAEAEKKWGSTEAWAEYEEKSGGRSRRENADIEAGLDNIFTLFAECRAAGHAPDSAEAGALVRRLQSYITQHYYAGTDAILAGLGRTYTADERFRTNIDRHGEGTAEYAARAIEHALGAARSEMNTEG